MLTVADQISRIPFDLVVCDEGHRLKNSQIKINTLLCSLSTKRRILVTGTPIQNDLMEFFNTVDFVNPGVFGDCYHFKKDYEDPIVASRQPEADVDTRALGLSKLKKVIKIIRV